MRVALVHDWLATNTGAERVLEQMLRCYPQADVFALVDFLPEADRGFLGGRMVKTTWLQKAPFARKRFRHYLALMPYMIEEFDLSGYDLVLSSSWAFAKGVITGADQPHVSYMHTPIRYASSMKFQYLEQAGLTRGLRSLYVKYALHRIRQWDMGSIHGVDLPLANSAYIARRIRKTYGRAADVIHPPVALDDFPLQRRKQDYYLCVSRLVHYKRVDMVVEAFAQMPDKKLVVIGDGEGMGRAQAMATPNVSLLGWQPKDVLVRHMQDARAFVMPAEEDFGIVMAEAQASGTPVLAFGRGGAPEILQTGGAGPTGMLFDEQSPEAIIDAVERFENLAHDIDPAACRRNAERFAPAEFRRQFKSKVDDALDGYGLPKSRPKPAAIPLAVAKA